MPNPNPNLDNLKSYKPKWKSGKTRTIRVPVAIADRVLDLAHQLDEKKSLDTSEYTVNNRNEDSLKPDSNYSNNIIDTSDSNREKAKNILLEALAVRSNQGAKIKTKISLLGELFGWQIEKQHKNSGWTITDTSE